MATHDDVHGSSQDNFMCIVPEENVGIGCVRIIALEHKYYVNFSVNTH